MRKHVYKTRTSLDGAAVKKTNLTLDTVKRITGNPTALVGMILFGLIIVIAIIGPFIAPYGYKEMDLTAQYAAPSAKHWFGCDALGRDIFSRILYGARYSLGLGLCTTIVSLCIGIVFGAVAGFFGGVTENIIMRLMDVLQALPATLLAIVISAALGNGFVNTVIAMAVSRIPGSCRMLRAQILSIRKSEYIEAAQSINCSTFRVILKHIIPNAFSPLIVSTTMGIGMTIQAAAGLSFIGLGVQPPTPEWGAMLSEGRNFLRQYPHMAIFPGLAIALTILSVNLFGDGLRDALDPKLKR